MMAQKDAKDILRDIKADIEGVDPKDIQFQDLRKRRNKKKKVEKSNESESGSGIIGNTEGFSLLEVETKCCDYRDISKKGKLREKGSLEEWGPFDFFKFAHKLYVNRYQIEWDLNMGGSSLEINRIKDKFVDVFGYCCNLMIYDYIVYFFEYHIDYFKNKDGFYFSQMKTDWIILTFQETYDFRERFVNYMTQKKQKNKKYQLTHDEIQKSYDMGDTTLIGNYGIVIALNWLLKIKKINKKDAIKVVVDACKDMYKKHLIDVVQSATEIYSPYPVNLIFKSPQLVLNKIDKNIKLKVEFNDNNQMEFLQKGDNTKGA
jgi:hypothetical protein